MGEGLTVHGRKNPDALDEIEKLTTEIMEILNILRNIFNLNDTGLVICIILVP
jgi:hypothetical protein